jgi:hypothetical protein
MISAEEALRRRPAEAVFRGELRVASQRVPMGPFDLSKDAAPVTTAYKATA